MLLKRVCLVWFKVVKYRINVSKLKYKVKRVDWYGFNHSKIIQKFEGDLSFCNEFCVFGESSPVAVYKAKTPNKSKGHKKYMLLQMQNNLGLVRGMTAQQMKKERYQDAVLCLGCNVLLYSITGHHYHTCGCYNETMVDGGKSYIRCGGLNLDLVKVVKFDLITNKIVNK